LHLVALATTTDLQGLGDKDSLLSGNNVCIFKLMSIADSINLKYLSSYLTLEFLIPRNEVVTYCQIKESITEGGRFSKVD